MSNRDIFLTGHTDTLNFVKKVRERFLRQPETFREFRRILSRLNLRSSEPNDETQLEQVAEIAALFSQHGDLFSEFLEFLPSGYSPEIQKDSILLHNTASADYTTERGRELGKGINDLPAKWSANDHPPHLVDTPQCRRIQSQAVEFRRAVKSKCSQKTYREIRAAFNQCFSSKSESLFTELVARVVVILHRHSDLVEMFRELMQQVIGGEQMRSQMAIKCLDRGLYELKGRTSEDSMFIMVDDTFINNEFV